MIKSINYKQAYQNIYNLEWSGWRDFLDTVKYVEDCGSKSKKYPDNQLMHGIQFINNYYTEEAVRRLLKLEFLGDDHEELKPRAGVPNTPDFIDPRTRETYELKCRFNLDAAFNNNWNDADHCLLLCAQNNVLYEYFPQSRTFERIKEDFRAPYINQRKYPYSQQDIENAIKK